MLQQPDLILKSPESQLDQILVHLVLQNIDSVNFRLVLSVDKFDASAFQLYIKLDCPWADIYPFLRSVPMSLSALGK
jgi:hypothetical protein